MIIREVGEIVYLPSCSRGEWSDNTSSKNFCSFSYISFNVAASRKRRRFEIPGLNSLASIPAADLAWGSVCRDCLACSKSFAEELQKLIGGKCGRGLLVEGIISFHPFNFRRQVELEGQRRYRNSDEGRDFCIPLTPILNILLVLDLTRDGDKPSTAGEITSCPACSYFKRKACWSSKRKWMPAGLEDKAISSFWDHLVTKNETKGSLRRG